MCIRSDETNGLFKCFLLCLLLIPLGEVKCMNGAPAIESFTVNSIDVSTFPNQLVIVTPHSEAVLECTIHKIAAKTWTIYIRDLTGKVLATSLRAAKVVYTIDRFQCIHLGTYICDVENGSHQLGKLLVDLTTELCPPLLIKGQDSTKTLVSPISSNQTFSFASLAHVTMQPTLFLRNTSLLNGSSTDKFEFQMLPIQKSSLLFVTSILIKNVSASDYGRWNVKLFTGSIKLLSLNIIIKPEGNISWVQFKEYRGETEPEIELICNAVGYPRHMEIRRRHDDNPMGIRISDGLHHIIQLKHISVDVGCSFMATYVCQVTTFEGEIIRQPLDVAMKDCNPSLCHHQPKNKTAFLNAGESVNITFCVSAHPQLSDNSDIKLLPAASFNGTSDAAVPECKVHITAKDSKIHSNVTLEFINITGLGFGCYIVCIRNAKFSDFTICLVQRVEGKHLTLCEGYPYHQSLGADLKSNITVQFCVSSNIGLGTHIGINDIAYRLSYSNASLNTTGLDIGFNGTETFADISNQTGHNHLCGSRDHDTSIYITASYSQTSNLNFWVTVSLQYLNETNFREYTLKLKPNLNVTLDLTFSVKQAKKQPKPCKEQDTERVIFAKRNADVTVGFCVETVSKLDQTVIVSGVKIKTGIDHPKIDIRMFQGTGQEVIVKVTVKNITSLDFKIYDIKLRSMHLESTATLTFVLVEQIPQAKPEGILVTINGVKIPHFVEQEVQLIKGRQASFECKTRNTAIKRLWLHDDRKIVLNETKHKSIKVYFRKVSCEDEGAYHCVVEGVNSWILEHTSVPISVSGCFPVTCTDELYMKTVTVSLGQTVTLSFCVDFVYNKRKLPHVLYNSSLSLHASVSYDYTWAFSEGYTHKNNLTITIYNITHEQFKEHIFLVTSKNAESLELKILIDNFVLDNSTSELRSSVGPTDQICLWIALPIVFALIVIGSLLAQFLLKKNAPEKEEYLLQGTTVN